jgi:hypothetical protein
MNEVWKWTKKRELAAELIAEALLSFKEIAEKVKCSNAALSNWRRFPEFKERVEQLGNEFRNRIRTEGIAIIENRVQAVNDRWKKMKQVIDARAADPQMLEVPGGKTGLLVHKIKQIGSGPEATTVDEYEVDTGILKEMLDHEQQAAQELGQWKSKTELSGNAPIRFVIEGLSQASWIPKPESQDNSTQPNA